MENTVVFLTIRRMSDDTYDLFRGDQISLNISLSEPAYATNN